MPRRIFIRDGGLTSSLPTPAGFTVIGSDGGSLKKQINSNIYDLVTDPTTLKAIHVPFSKDNMSPIMGFSRGAKLRTNVFYPYNIGNNTIGSPFANIGLVYGESSIKTLNQKPQLLNGYEKKFEPIATDNDGNTKIRFIKSLVQDSQQTEVQMEYLYHEGQSTINTLPIVHFDGSYITVDARETDILEDTYLWYVIRGVAGTTIDISIQIFVCNCEEGVLPGGWPNPAEEGFDARPTSVVSAIFSGNSSYRINFIQKSDSLMEKVGQYFNEISKESIDCNLVSTIKSQIDNLRTEVTNAYDDWVNNDTIIEAPPDNYNSTFYIFNTVLDNFYNEMGSLWYQKNSDFENFECSIKDSLRFNTLCGNTGNINYAPIYSYITKYYGEYLRDHQPDKILLIQSVLNNDVLTTKNFYGRTLKESIKFIDDFYFNERVKFTNDLLKYITKRVVVIKLKRAVEEYQLLGSYFSDLDTISNIVGCS